MSVIDKVTHTILVARGRCLCVFGALPRASFNSRHLNLKICRPTKLAQMSGNERKLIPLGCVYVSLALGVREITK